MQPFFSVAPSFFLSFFFLLSFFLDFPLTEWIGIAVLLCNCSPPSPLRPEWGAELSKQSACQLNRRSGRELQVLPRPSASLVEGGGGETARRGVQTPSDLGGPWVPIFFAGLGCSQDWCLREEQETSCLVVPKGGVAGWVCVQTWECLPPCPCPTCLPAIHTLTHAPRHKVSLRPCSPSSLGWGQPLRRCCLYCFKRA